MATTQVRKAFTLLEILLVVTMSAVLAGALYATMRGAFAARDIAQKQVDNYRRGELAAEFVCNDLRSAAVPNGILAGTFYGEDDTGPISPDSDSVEFYRIADATDQDLGQGDIMKVELSCETSSSGNGMDLVRRVTRNLLAQTTYDVPGETICRGVLKFNLRYYDGLDWLDTWDSSTVDNSLPVAIAVDIVVAADEDGRPVKPGMPTEYQATHVLWLPASTLEVGMQVESTQ